MVVAAVAELGAPGHAPFGAPPPGSTDANQAPLSEMSEMQSKHAHGSVNDDIEHTDEAIGEEPRKATHGRPMDPELAAPLAVAALIVFTLLKAYAAANFSLTTAGALLTTAPINVFLGTLESYSYDVFPLIGLAALTWALIGFRAHGWDHWRTAWGTTSIQISGSGFRILMRQAAG